MKSLLHKYVLTPVMKHAYVLREYPSLSNKNLILCMCLFVDGDIQKYWHEDLIEVNPYGNTEKEIFQLADGKSDSWIVPQQNKRL